MVERRYRLVRKRAFTLPTVVIVSVVMLALLATAMQLVSTTSRSLQGLYYQSLAREAAEAGLVMAEDCAIEWDGPLRPGSGCEGSATQCTNADCYVVNQSDIRTTFSVATQARDGSGVVLVEATGTAERIRPNGSVWSTYTHTVKGQYAELQWKKVSAGYTHSLGLTADGTVYSWGSASYGQLGNGAETGNFTKPVLVDVSGTPMNRKKIVDVVAGPSHSYAIDSDGRVYFWGANGYGHLGDGKTSGIDNDVLKPISLDTAGTLLGSRYATKIATSMTHTLILDATGNVWGMGWTLAGRLANGQGAATFSRTSHITGSGTPMSAKSIVDVAVSDYHSMALTSDGQIFTWGLDEAQFYNPSSNIYSTVPVRVATAGTPMEGKLIVGIAANNQQSFAWDSEGRLYVWGSGGRGLLGRGLDMDTPNDTPTLLDVAGTPVEGQTVVGLSISNDSSASSGGLTHSLAIGWDGTAYAWGDASRGKLGDGFWVAPPQDPKLVRAEGTPMEGKPIVHMEAGKGHSLALSAEGSIYAWGDGAHGVLGDGATFVQTRPKATKTRGISAKDYRVRQLAGGDARSCALVSTLSVYCWGLGPLGDGVVSDSSIPLRISRGEIPDESTVRSIAGGQAHVCALTYSGTPYCWGNNQYGQIGSGTSAAAHAPTPVRMSGVLSGKYVKDLSMGHRHTCSVASDGWAYCWGDGSNGKLGRGSTSSSSVPVAVSRGAIPPNATIVKIAAGHSHTCALASDSWVYCWGGNSHGQLGNGSTTGSNVPVAIVRGAMFSSYTAKDLVVGHSHTCIISSNNNRSYCWGLNSSGQLGSGSTSSSSTPVAVATGAMPSLRSLLSMTAGASHTCAITYNNRAYCWGLNSSGQLGDGSTTSSNTPVAVATGAMPRSLLSMTAGASHTCAITYNNLAYCWGDNVHGNLGIGTTINSPTPVSVRKGALSEIPFVY